MDWSKVYSYCERGFDPAFWAEPFNAVSNGAFILAGLAAAVMLARSPRSDRALFEWILILLVLLIGTGSFMFHTYATIWSIPFARCRSRCSCWATLAMRCAALPAGR